MKNRPIENIEKTILQLGDERLAVFNSRLINNIEPTSIIGVKIPDLRKLAKKIIKQDKVSDSSIAEEFMSKLPHKYFEENLLHAFLVGEMKDLDIALALTEKFLPFIDNWAVCDSFSPKIFGSFDEIENKWYAWLKGGTYYKRFAIVSALKNYIKKDFSMKQLEAIMNASKGDYMVDMAIAWYLSQLVFYKKTIVIDILRDKNLDAFLRNKTISKIVDSNKSSSALKEEVRGIRKEFKR